MMNADPASYTTDSRGNPTIHGTTGSLAVDRATALAPVYLQMAGLSTSNPIPLVGSTAAPYSRENPATADAVKLAAAAVKRSLDVMILHVNADSAAIVSNLRAHARAHVTVEQLGRVPSGGAGTPIDAPSAPVDIPIQ